MTPSSSNSEETHNTLKFAHRAKHIEIQAAQNKVRRVQIHVSFDYFFWSVKLEMGTVNLQIIDEKSLIKKYQNEIRRLKEELEQLKKGIVTVPQMKDSGEDLVLLKQKVTLKEELSPLASKFFFLSSVCNIDWKSTYFCFIQLYQKLQLVFSETELKPFPRDQFAHEACFLAEGPWRKCDNNGVGWKGAFFYETKVNE